MKSIKQLREQYDLITEKEEKEERQLTSLVRAGLYDAKKLPALKKALDKSADKITAQEKRMLINLLDALMNQVLSNQSVYQKVKQNVMKESVDKPNFSAGIQTPNQKNPYSMDHKLPSVILMKRKAIRVYPDGQKVGLYYAQAIDRYITVPFTDAGISGINESFWSILGRMVGSDDEDSGKEKPEPKYTTPKEPKMKLNLRNAERGRKSDAIDSRTDRLHRMAAQAQADQSKKDLKEFTAPTGVDSSNAKDITNFFNKNNPVEKVDKVTKKAPRKPTTIRPKPKPATKAEPSFTDKAKEYGTQILKSAITRAIGKAAGVAGAAWTGLGVRPANPDEPATIRATPADKQNWGGVVKAPKKSTVGDAGSVNRLGKPQPKIETLPPKTDGSERLNDTRQHQSELPSATSKQQTTADGKSDLETKLQQKSNASDKADMESTPKPNNKQKPKPKPKSKKASSTRLRDIAATAALGTLTLAGAKGKELNPKGPKLALSVEGPKRVGDADAINSRRASLDRAVAKAAAGLKEMVEVDLNGNLFELNKREAQKVSKLYESLNKANKDKMVAMMKEGDESLGKVISFAVRQ